MNLSEAKAMIEGDETFKEAYAALKGEAEKGFTNSASILASQVGVDLLDKEQVKGLYVFVYMAYKEVLAEYSKGVKPEFEAGEIAWEDLPDYIGEKEAAALAWLRTHSVMPHPDSQHSRVLMDLLEKRLQAVIPVKTEGRKDG